MLGCLAPILGLGYTLGVSEPRKIDCVYADPLDMLWSATAEQIGMRIRRSNEVYASWDGRGTLDICHAKHMDADDCLAQMIFHEICHALVAGPHGTDQLDWGLFHRPAEDPVHEHATNRLQAALADEHGLRHVLATTTEFRAYYDALPEDPLAPGSDPAITLARDGWERARSGPWSEALAQALRSTARIAASIAGIVSKDSIWARAQPLHVSGFVLHANQQLTCGQCAWFHSSSDGAGCRQAEQAGRQGVNLSASQRACKRWETPLTKEACGVCGACCREGFHRVDLRHDDPIRLSHPTWVAGGEQDPHLPRPGGRCVALVGIGTKAEPFRCQSYAIRPNSCRQFEIGGAACLTARRRIRFSR